MWTDCRIADGSCRPSEFVLRPIDMLDIHSVKVGMMRMKRPLFPNMGKKRVQVLPLRVSQLICCCLCSPDLVAMRWRMVDARCMKVLGLVNDA
jgi:threonine/homoserine efflux transporter RhtA